MSAPIPVSPLSDSIISGGGKSVRSGLSRTQMNFTLPPMMGQRMVMPVQGDSFPSLDHRAEFGSLSHLAILHDVLYYCRHGVLEAATLTEPNFERQVSDTAGHLQHEAEVLWESDTVSGRGLHMRFDDTPTQTTERVVLSEDCRSVTAHKHTQGAVLAVPSVATGVHMWSMLIDNAFTTSIGVVSTVGVEKHTTCRDGSLPRYVACVRPGVVPRTLSLHWVDNMSMEHHEPILGVTIPDETTTVSVYIDFVAGRIVFFLGDKSLGTVDCNSALPRHAPTLAGAYTCFAHVAGGATARLLYDTPHTSRPFTSLQRTYTSTRAVCGNAHVRWGRYDGVHYNAAFEMPLAVAALDFTAKVYVADGSVVREIDPSTDTVTTRQLNMLTSQWQVKNPVLSSLCGMKETYWLFAVEATTHTILMIDARTFDTRVILWNCITELNMPPIISEERQRDVRRHVDILCSRDAAMCQYGSRVLPFIQTEATLAIEARKSFCDDPTPSKASPAMSNNNDDTVVGLEQHATMSRVPRNMYSFAPHDVVAIGNWIFMTDPARHVVLCAQPESSTTEDLDVFLPNSGCEIQLYVIAGELDEPGCREGAGEYARLCNPTGLVADPENPVLYVSDTGNRRLLKIDLAWQQHKNIFTTQVYNMTVRAPIEGGGGNEEVVFNAPLGMAVHKDINGKLLYVADVGTETVYQVTVKESALQQAQKKDFSFVSPFEKIVKGLKTLKREADTIPHLPITHGQSIQELLELMFDSSNIYELQYMGEQQDTDVARWLVANYDFRNLTSEGINDGRASGRSPNASDSGRDTNVLSVKSFGVELTNVDSWDKFNIFEAAQQSEAHGGALVQVALHVFQSYDAVRKYQIDLDRLVAFTSKISTMYKDTLPYHNAAHAADVLQAVHVFLQTTTMEHYFTSSEIVALLIAAIIHDVEHPGVSNQFLIATEDDLALQYNDSSVLENHHLRVAFHVLRHREYNILEYATDADRRHIRNIIIDLILGTDMKHHFSILSTLKQKWSASSGEGATPSEDTRRCVLKAVLACADMSNILRPQKLYFRWVSRLFREHRAQGEREEILGLPVTTFCELKPDMRKSQRTFMDYILAPLFVHMCERFPELTEILEIGNGNRSYWDVKSELPLEYILTPSPDKTK
eukprot:PhM_4_TR10440/c0_g1_i1/m.96374/K13293/PDE4; cAMP-specific phosphodiesterase 4